MDSPGLNMMQVQELLQSYRTIQNKTKQEKRKGRKCEDKSYEITSDQFHIGLSSIESARAREIELFEDEMK